MKSPRIFLLTLLFALPAGPVQAIDLNNPGFEIGLTGWEVDEDEPVSQTSQDAAHQGDFGLRIEAPGAKLDSELLEVSPGSKIVVKFWARATKSALGAVLIVPCDANKRPIALPGGKAALTIKIKECAEWTQFEGEHLMPDNTQAVFIRIRSWSGAKGVLSLDDFEVEIN